MTRLLLAVVITALTAGCGGSSSSSAPTTSVDSASKSVTGTVATPTTDTTTYATNQQYASIVSKEEPGFNKILRDMLNPAHCVWFHGAPDVRPGSFTCSIQVDTLYLKALNLEIELTHAQHTNGPPPPELASLVAQTVRTTDQLKVTANKAQPCALKPKPGCTKKLFEFSGAMNAMQSQLAAWRPYE